MKGRFSRVDFVETIHHCLRCSVGFNQLDPFVCDQGRQGFGDDLDSGITMGPAPPQRRQVAKVGWPWKGFQGLAGVELVDHGSKSFAVSEIRASHGVAAPVFEVQLQLAPLALVVIYVHELTS